MSSMLWIDLETTGFSSNAAVIELAAIPFIDGEYSEPFQIYIAPHPGASIDPEALKVNKIDPKKFNTFASPKEAVNQFIEWIDKHEKVFTLSGHNIQFDKKRLFALFCRTENYGNYISRFRFDDYCTMKDAKALFKGKKNQPEGFNLKDLCKHFKVDLTNAHSALPDIEATIRVYQELKKLKMKEIPIRAELSYAEKRLKYMSNEYLCLNPEGDCFINSKAMKDPEAMVFILGELWELTQKEN